MEPFRFMATSKIFTGIHWCKHQTVTKLYAEEQQHCEDTHAEPDQGLTSALDLVAAIKLPKIGPQDNKKAFIDLHECAGYPANQHRRVYGPKWGSLLSAAIAGGKAIWFAMRPLFPKAVP